MAEYVTKQDVQEIVQKAVSQAVTDLSEVVANFAGQVDERFTGVEHRLDSIDQRLDGHDERFRQLNSKYDHLLNTIDDFIKRIDHYETERVAQDHKIARLEKWIEQIATKTGVKLEY